MGDDELLLAAAGEAPTTGASRERTALATVVSVTGSAYRREGARMLVRPDGTRVGGVSGGCLEAEVVEHALEAARRGEPQLLRFDTSDPDDAVFGYGSGCAGVVEVLVEQAAGDDSRTALHAVGSARSTREPTVLLTSLSSELLGARAWWTDGVWRGRLAAHLAGVRPHELSRHGGMLVARSGLAGELVLADQGWRVAWEVLEPPLRLLHVGADEGASELAGAARALGWEVTVLDYRPALLDPARFAPGVHLVACEGRALGAYLQADRRTAVVVASRRWLYDVAAMAALTAAAEGGPPAYLGLIGSRQRVAALLSSHGAPSAGALRAPAGLTGATARTPAEIAAAVVAEILRLRPKEAWWPEGDDATMRTPCGVHLVADSQSA